MPSKASYNPNTYRVSIPPKTSGTHTATTAIAAAHTNPTGLDILQVVNEGGKVVWNLDINGNSNTNPAHPTNGAHLGQHFGSSFSQAFPDAAISKLDVYQIHDGSTVVHHVDYLGVSYTP